MTYNTGEAAESLMIEERDLLEILEVFFHETTDILLDCDKAFKNGDSGTLKKLFHSLKGSSANFRMNHLSELAARMENGAGSSDWKLIAETMPLFLSELESIQKQARKK